MTLMLFFFFAFFCHVWDSLDRGAKCVQEMIEK